MCQDPIFAAIEVHHCAGWQRLDEACTKAGVLSKSPLTTTVAALNAAVAERKAISDQEEWPAYEKLVATAIAGLTPDAVMPLLRHMSKFELTQRLSDDELRQFVYSIGDAAAKA